MHDAHHARARRAHEGVEVEDDVLVAAAVAVEAAAVLWLPLVILEDLVVPVRSGSGSGPELASELAFWRLMAVLRSGAGGVGGGCAVEGGLVFGLGGSGCRWAEVGGGGLLARAYFSSSFLFDILGAGASGPGADTRIGVRIA